MPVARSTNRNHARMHGGNTMAAEIQNTNNDLSCALDPDRQADFPADGAWSACQAAMDVKQKEVMARCFAEHDLLVAAGEHHEGDSRERAAYFVVGPGTTPNTVLHFALEWVSRHWRLNPVTLTWISLGALTPATIFQFKKNNPHCLNASRLILCPGRVDPMSETLEGKHPVGFLEKLSEEVHVDACILSAHSFDMTTGDAYFYFDNEVDVQRAGALVYARDKYLFLSPNKFRSIRGWRGYHVRDLLKTSQSVTIYTTTSNSDQQITRGFEELCGQIGFARLPAEAEEKKSNGVKRLRLCIVSTIAEPVLDIQAVAQ